MVVISTDPRFSENGNVRTQRRKSIAPAPSPMIPIPAHTTALNRRHPGNPRSLPTNDVSNTTTRKGGNQPMLPHRYKQAILRPGPQVLVRRGRRIRPTTNSIHGQKIHNERKQGKQKKRATPAGRSWCDKDGQGKPKPHGGEPTPQAPTQTRANQNKNNTQTHTHTHTQKKKKQSYTSGQKLV